SLMRPFLVVRPDFQPGDVVAAFESRAIDAGVEGKRAIPLEVPDERLSRRRVAQIIAVRPDEIGAVGALFEEGDVADLAPRPLDQDAVNEGVEKRGIGLRLYRDPLGGERAGDREMRLDLDAFHAARTRAGVPPHSC